MSKIRKGYVDITGGQIHYRHRRGEGEPVVLLHQTASSSAMYDAVMAAWSGPQDVYALDTPGFGGSFDPEGQPDMAAYGDWIKEAIHSLGFEQVHLFGHHTGAAIGVEIAARHPDLVSSFSMIGPVVLTPEEREAFKGVYPKAVTPSADGAHLRVMWEYVQELGGEGIDMDLWQREFVDTARAWRGHIQVYSSIWDQDFGALLDQVRAPMLMMCSPDDVLWPVFERAKERRPDAQFLAIAGHNFQPDEVPAEVAAAVNEFVAAVG